MASCSISHCNTNLRAYESPVACSQSLTACLVVRSWLSATKIRLFVLRTFVLACSAARTPSVQW